MKETLSGKKEEYRTMIEESPLGVSLIGRDGDYRYINPRFTEIFGYTLEDIPTGREWFEKAYPDEEYRNRVISTWISDLKKSERGESRPRVFTVTCKDGSERVIHFRAVTIETGGQFVIYEDITERTRADGLLRKSEEKFRGLAERSFDAIYELDLNGRTTYVSPAVERITGYRPEELLGKSFWNHVPEGEMTKALQALTTLRKGRNIEGLQVEIVRKDGSRASVEINACPIMRNGEVIGCQGVFRNITERKRVEEELEESRSHFQSLFNLMVDPVVIVDGKGKILELTNGVQKVTGFKREELVGKNFMTTKVVTAKSKAILVKNLAKRMMGMKIPPYEIEILTKDGKKIPIEANAAKITYRGKPADMAVFRDITERKRAEEERKSSEERLRILFEFAPDGIYLNDSKGTFIDGNKAAQELVGYKREELIGKNFLKLKLLPPEQIPKAAANLAKNALGKSTGPDEFILNRKDGKQVTVEISTYPVKIKDDTLVLGIARDITERKKAEEELKKSEKRFRDVFEQSRDALYKRNLRTGQYEYMSPAITEITGYTPDEAMAMSPNEIGALIHPEDMGEINKLRQRLLKKPQDSQMTGTAEYRVKCKDGNYCWVADRFVLVSGADGKPMFSIASVRDITERKKAEGKVERTLKKLRRVLEATIQAMALTVEMRDAYTAGHQRRVTNLAFAIAKEMHLSEDKVDGIRMAGSIHDIGKIGVPGEILNKPVRLADMEFELIKTHPVIGYNILKEIQFPWPVATIVLQHHERIDGSGYPSGLSGDAILIEARILGVADVVEALASHRPYRPALGIDKALEEVKEKRGTLYDPEVVDACLKLFTEKGFKFE